MDSPSVPVQTLEEAVAYAKVRFRQLVVVGELSLTDIHRHQFDLHHGFGTLLRNELALWSEESPLKSEIWSVLPAEQRAALAGWYGADEASFRLPADEASSEIIRRALEALRLEELL